MQEEEDRRQRQENILEGEVNVIGLLKDRGLECYK